MEVCVVISNFLVCVIFQLWNNDIYFIIKQNMITII